MNRKVQCYQKTNPGTREESQNKCLEADYFLVKKKKVICLKVLIFQLLPELSNTMTTCDYTTLIKAIARTCYLHTPHAKAVLDAGK